MNGFVQCTCNMHKDDLYNFLHAKFLFCTKFDFYDGVV